MAFEVVTTTNKQDRDRMFDDLRQNGNHLEKQVVKFSGQEKVLDNGEPLIVYSRMDNGLRFVYRSNWSLAYPTN